MAELSSELEQVIKREVDTAVDTKLAEYRRLVYAFLSGLTLLLGILVANRLISESSLVEWAGAQIFGIDKKVEGLRQGIEKNLDKKVNFSYTNQFWLEPGTSPVQFVAFYASAEQHVYALLDVQHKGRGPVRAISIRLNQEPIWQGDGDINFQRIDLTDRVRAPKSLIPGPQNVHFLTFEMAQTSQDRQAGAPEDKVSVRVLINVIGLEGPAS